jgi:hypothetical protein
MVEQLRKRIAEIEAVIRTEEAKLIPYRNKLIAYQNVLDSELGKPGGKVPTTSVAAHATISTPKYTGDKTAFVLDILRAHGYLGATTQDINRAFMERSVEKGKNLVYVALNALIGREQVKRRGNHYFFCEVGAESARRNQRSRKDDLVEFLEANGPTRRTDIAARTKINIGTVGFHLQDGKIFAKLPDGRYALRTAIDSTPVAHDEFAEKQGVC